MCPPYLHLSCFSEGVAIHSLYHSWAFKSLLRQTPVSWEIFARGATVLFQVLLIFFESCGYSSKDFWMAGPLFAPRVLPFSVCFAECEVFRDTSHYSRNTYVLLCRWHYPRMYFLCCGWFISKKFLTKRDRKYFILDIMEHSLCLGSYLSTD